MSIRVAALSWTFVCLVVLLVSAPARAQSPASPTPPPSAAPAPPPPASPSPPAPTAAPAPPSSASPPAPSADDLTMTFRASDMESFASRSARDANLGGIGRARYSLNLFGDVGGGVEGGPDIDTKPTFGLGGLDLLFSGDLDNAIKLTAESAIEFDENNQVGIDLERMHLRWTMGGFWLEAGRSHTDLGYWNLAYHHGRWLQPTIERPRAVRFEDDGGILPVHWVGLQAGYKAQFGPDVAWTTSVAIGNGRGAIVDNIQSRVDTHAPKQIYAKTELKGLFTRDLRIGVSGVYGYISPQHATVRPALPDVGLFEYIGNAYIAHASYPLDLIAEGYAIVHDGAGQRWVTYDAFAVAGYTIGIVTPYLAGERLVMTGGTDPFFVPGTDPAAPAPELDVVGGIAGLRIDLSTWSAVKVEYRLDRLVDRATTRHTGYASWQFGI